MSLVPLLLAAALSAGGPPQDPPPLEARVPVELEGLTITGRSLDAFIHEFVDEVSEPNRGRNLARWDTPVCIGVANLRPEVAQAIVDRISGVAADLGVRTGAPGCAPNVLVVVTTDAGATARAMVRDRRTAFRSGTSGADRGSAALDDFISTPRPVRWWQTATVRDAVTGEPIHAAPGQCRGPCMDAPDFGPTLNRVYASRLISPVVDSLDRAVVIVDKTKVEALTALQLADYIAMVALAQVDPDARPSAYASILNIFDAVDPPTELTEWDRAYLSGLYDADRNRTSRRASRGEVVDAIADANRRLRETVATAAD
jgi:hypothetical protein